MGRKCSVENCTSDSTRPEHIGVTFHKVPHHPDVRPKWISLCRIPDDKANAKVLYICSRHFLRADFCSFKGKKYMLRQGVLPSVFPWDKSKLEALKAEASNKKDVEISKKKEKPKTVKKKEEKMEDSSSSASQSEGSSNDEHKIEPKEIESEVHETATSQIDLLANYEVKTIKDEINSDINNEIDAFDQHQRLQDTTAATCSINFAINSRIEVLDNNNIWYPAKINEVDYEESEVLIHFEKFSTKYDEWISMSSPRLRPIQIKCLEKYEVGERCMAIWIDSRKFPATVTRVIDAETYEVLFDDGLTKSIKTHKMSKMDTSKPPHASPLFEPVKSTKQERRDRKRKLNVAALFRKRPRASNSDDKKNKPLSNAQTVDEVTFSPGSPQETNISLQPMDQWLPTWENGKPVGVESTIETTDGIRKSVIVPDPRVPQGWQKHLSQKTQGTFIGKWETIILSPDGKKFKSKTEIKNYLDQNPDIQANIDMFDFNIYRNSHKKKLGKSKQKLVPENQSELVVEEPIKEEPQIKEEVEEPPISLKIIFENDSYKCPIDGCGKTFRRENLALMHVKHYHSEYTKYLDSTPNVADLAYARTVGENLDRSPGPVKNITPKATVEKPPVPAKVLKTLQPTTTEAKVSRGNSPSPENKNKDSEIIKLLNQKPSEINKDIQPLPSGLPSNMYPDIKLKDLLDKKEDMPMRDDINIKTLCASRPTHGIKTLLPVRPSQSSSNDSCEEKPHLKRKRAPSESTETHKGKSSYQAASAPTPDQHHAQQPPQQKLHSQLPLIEQTTSQSPLSESAGIFSSVPTAFDLAPPPAGLEATQTPPSVAQFDGVIIEGGKIIKLERMKQEEIINCTCGFMEEDGLMIQCELCLCWQHAYCNNIQKESEVPEKYICYICQHPLRERRSMKFLHDQDWLKQGVLPVASYHAKDEEELQKRFEKLKKCHDLSGGMLELREYLHALAYKLKIAEAKNHPKLYLWSKPWEKPKLPEKCDIKKEDISDIKLKVENVDHQYIKNETDKQEPQNDSMLMMILKGSKDEIPMLNMHNNIAPIIPQPEAPINSDDCRLNLLDHISHSESLIDERLDDFEKQLNVLEEGMNLETEENYPKTRQTLQLMMRDLETLKRFSELPMV